MGFDLFQSRRNFNERCEWWSRNESEDLDDNELVYKQLPSGSFFAKEENAEAEDDNLIGGIIMVDRTTVTIKSPDDLRALVKKYVMKNRVLVKYQGDLWRVQAVQKRKARIQNSEFADADNVSHYWYLTLIK